MLLDTVDEDLADSFHLVLHRQAEESSESRILNVPLEKERPGSKVEREMVRSTPLVRGPGSVLVIKECREEVCKIFRRIVEANDWDAIDCFFGIGGLEWSQSKHIPEYLRLARQDADVELEQGTANRGGVLGLW